MNTLTRKRTHFPRTTASQRKLLFQTWQATGDVELACRKAHVSEGTYYGSTHICGEKVRVEVDTQPKHANGSYQIYEIQMLDL